MSTSFSVSIFCLDKKNKIWTNTTTSFIPFFPTFWGFFSALTFYMRPCTHGTDYFVPKSPEDEGPLSSKMRTTKRENKSKNITRVTSSKKGPILQNFWWTSRQYWYKHIQHRNTQKGPNLIGQRLFSPKNRTKRLWIVFSGYDEIKLKSKALWETEFSMCREGKWKGDNVRNKNITTQKNFTTKCPKTKWIWNYEA